MKWPSVFRRTSKEYEAPAKGIKGATLRMSSQADRFRSRITEEAAEMDRHREFCRIYETSVAGAIIDTETDDLFAQGWALQGEAPEDVAKVREYLTVTNFETEVKKLCTESKVYGFGIAEVGTTAGRHILVAHSSFNILPVMDDMGWLVGYIQKGTDGTIAEFDRREVVTMALRPSASTPGTGRSELAQAYDAIIDYENTRKANAAMIERMGYPAYDIEFSDSDGIVPADMLEGEIADLAPGSVLSTGLGAKINTLNAQGVTQVQTYAETMLQAVAVAMQIPRAMAGLSDNSEATAKVTLSKYYNRIAAEQAIVAQTIQARYLDVYVLPDLGIKAGSVQIQFNNPDPEASLKKAQLIQLLATIDPADPEFLLSVEELAEIWGKHPQSGEYEGSKLRDQLVDGIMHRLAEAQNNGGVVE